MATVRKDIEEVSEKITTVKRIVKNAWKNFKINDFKRRLFQKVHLGRI